MTTFRLRREFDHCLASPTIIYRVMLGDKAVGSILGHRLPHVCWEWSVTGILGSPPGVQYGSATSREDAMAAWRACWERITAGPHSVLCAGGGNEKGPASPARARQSL